MLFYFVILLFPFPWSMLRVLSYILAGGGRSKIVDSQTYGPLAIFAYRFFGLFGEEKSVCKKVFLTID